MQFKRRRLQKTDYSQRLALLRSGKLRLVARKTDTGFRLQIIKFEHSGDTTITEVSSAMLKKYGWKGHPGNLSAAYLTGLLAGLSAKKKGVVEVVPDLGLQISVTGSSLYACLLGARDAGLKFGIGKDMLPKKERIEGAHVAAYARSIKNDQKKYSRQFANYLKNGIDPEKLQEHFQEVRKKILEGADRIEKAEAK
jgi:large subunit ribosomal protein L18